MDELRQALRTLRPYLEKRCDDLVGLPENCDDDDELKAISDVLDMCCSASCQ
jgi:hypothetical protein